jgi:hypothetical protein
VGLWPILRPDSSIPGRSAQRDVRPENYENGKSGRWLQAAIEQDRLLFVQRISMGNILRASNSIVGMTAMVCGPFRTRKSSLARLETRSGDRNITMQMWKWNGIPW